MEQEIIQGLMARGLPQHVAQGIVANMIAESSLNPGINEISPTVPGSRGGYGLNQWTGPRRVQFEAFARDRGASLDDLDTQLDFTLWELQNTERRAGDALAGTESATDAARVYSNQFLRPGIPHMDTRLGNAARLSGGNYRPTNALVGAENAPVSDLSPQNALAAKVQRMNALSAFMPRTQQQDAAPFMNRLLG